MPAKKIVPLPLFKRWQREPKECADMAAAKDQAMRDHRRMAPAYLESSSVVLLLPDRTRMVRDVYCDVYSSPRPFLLTVQEIEAREFYVWRDEGAFMALEPRWRVMVRQDPYGATRDAVRRGARAYVFARTYLARRGAGAAPHALEAAE